MILFCFSRNGDLFLSHDLHVRIASLIIDVLTKHAPEVIGSASISESVRQVSLKMTGQSLKQQFTTWCWNMISLLRLHCLDQSHKTVVEIIRSPFNLLPQIPELERLQSVFQGVAEQRPIALFVSVLSTQWGHSVPQICQKGFEQIQLLTKDCRHNVVIRCLQLLTPLFLECPESLAKCDK